MHNFGKMTLKKYPIEGHDLYKFIGLYFNKDGEVWQDLSKKYPHAIYAMVQDDGHIISWQDDPEQSQIDGIDIWGFTKKEAKKRGEHTHFDGKKFYTPDPEPDLWDVIKELKEEIKRLKEK